MEEKMNDGKKEYMINGWWREGGMGRIKTDRMIERMMDGQMEA